MTLYCVKRATASSKTTSEHLPTTTRIDSSKRISKITTKETKTPTRSNIATIHYDVERVRESTNEVMNPDSSPMSMMDRILLKSIKPTTVMVDRPSPKSMSME